MHKLNIYQLGPLKDIEFNIRKFNVLIGPQAAGKSTISKTIFLFKSLRDDLIKYFIDCVERNIFEKHAGNIGKIIRNKFIQLFGPTYNQNNINIEFYYSSDIYLKLTIKGKYINPEFSPRFREHLVLMGEEIKTFVQNQYLSNKRTPFSGDFAAFEALKNNFYKKITNDVSELLSEDKDVLFIPAGRSLLTTLTDQLTLIHPHRLDLTMKTFIEKINNTKPFFSKSFQDIVMDIKMLTNEKIDIETLKLAEQIIYNILKGKYKFDREGEKLFYDSSNYVKMSFASSGQQEAIWILLLIFLKLADNSNSFVVFEEPEAHLYPEAQKSITDLIALLANYQNNEVIITTHSPYILSSLNNLLYASKLANFNKKDVAKIIPEKTWLKASDFQAFFVNQGKIRSIIDEETHMIETEAIDSASEIINDIYYKLFNLDNE